MSALHAGLFVMVIAPLALALLLAWLVPVVRRLEQKWGKLDERELRARARGWIFVGQRQGDIAFQIHGEAPDGQHWRVEFDANHGSSTPQPALYFRVPGLAARRLEWRIVNAAAHRRRSNPVFRAAIGAGLRLQAALGVDVDDALGFLLQAREIAARSEWFRQSRVLLARDECWQHLLDDRLEWLLAGWDALPLMRDFRAELSVEGLVLRLGCKDPGFELIERVVRVGEGLAMRCRAADRS